MQCAYLHKLLWVWLLLRTKRWFANGWEKLISILYLISTSTGKRDGDYKKIMFWPYLSTKQTSGRPHGSDILTFNEKNKNFSIYFFPRCFVVKLLLNWNLCIFIGSNLVSLTELIVLFSDKSSFNMKWWHWLCSKL